MSTMKDIAATAGVGLGTVSRVVNGSSQVSPETRKRVEETMKALNYRPNRAARRLVQGESNTKMIGVLMPLFIHQFYFSVLKGINQYLFEHDLNLILFNRGQFPEEALKQIFKEDLSGLLVLSHDLSHAELSQLDREQLPVCFIDYRKESRASIWMDNYEGGKKAAEYFHEKSLKKVAFIGENTENQQQDDRVSGFRDACLQYGIDLAEQRFIPQQASVIREEVASLLSESDVQGIFFFSDSFAYNALPALAESRPVEVIGYDDQDPSEYIGLSTIRQPSEEIGYLGAEMLIEQVMEDREIKKELVISPELVKRPCLALAHLREAKTPQ
jgi:LacI family transcriptional regulator